MKTDGVHLAGIGTAVTGAVDTATAVSAGWWDERERRRSGLLSVSVAGSTPAPDLAVEAARRALGHAGRTGTTAGDVGALLHSSVHPQGPDGWSAPHYVNRLTVNQPVTSLEIRNGCIGFFAALQFGSCLLAAEDRPAVLITCADNFGTPAVDRWRASALFALADGGGAVVLSRRGGFAEVLAVGSSSRPELEERHRAGEVLFPPGLTTGATLNFQERTDRYLHGLVDGSIRPTEDFSLVLPDVVRRTLAEAGASMADVAVVVHDGFHRDAVDACFLDPLDVPPERGIFEFTRRAGHAGPVDHILGLEYAWRNRTRAGDLVLMVSDAPGMEAACAVLRITEDAAATMVHSA